ncbi:MAG: hypothetical protein H5T86_03055, partial [Armatimonadetes bacterium]|nr:hypothetical protein [Armatimonadota bacterium]
AAWQRLVVGQVLGVAPDGTSLTVQLPLVALRENVLDLWVVTRSGYAASLPQAFSIMSPVTSPELSASTAGQLQWPIRHPVWVWGRLHNSSARAAVGVSDQTGPATGITLLRVYCSSGIQRIFGPWFDALPRPGETPQIAWFLVAAVNPGMSFLYTVDAVKPQEPSEWKTTFITTEHEAITVARYSEFGQFLIDRLQANLGATGTTAMHPGWVYHNTPTGWPPVIQPDREAIASKYRWAWGYAMRHFRESARGAKVWGQVGYLCDLLSKEFDKLCQETPWPERLFFERAREDAEHWRDNFYAAGARDDLFAPGENLLPGIIEAWKEDVRRTYTQTTIPPRGPPPPPPPIDPNYKAGPGGDERTAWIGGGTRPAVYYIHFENKAEAKGAAINVVVTDRLDPDFDWRTVELDPAVVGASHPAITRAEFNAATGVITWTLAGINLPPNVNPPEGEGWVAFAVRPKAGLAHLTELRNRATVRFDSEAPMDTNETVVRVDMEPPTSKVNSAEPALGTSYKVAWSGNDGQGSGVSVYNVYVSEDGGPYVRWVGPTTATSEMFEGRPGHRYAFVCLATDMVGNVQAAPAQPDLVLDVPIDRGLLISLDFNGDNRINEWDLAAFIEAWKAANAAQPAKVDPRFDLAPWRGTIPNVESQPDGKIDHRDAALVLGAYLKLHGAEGPLPARIRKMALPPAPRAAP